MSNQHDDEIGLDLAPGYTDWICDFCELNPPWAWRLDQTGTWLVCYECQQRDLQLLKEEAKRIAAASRTKLI